MPLQISFIKLETHHLPHMLTWLNAPHVQQFWDSGIHWTEGLVRDKYVSYIDGYKLVQGIKKQIDAFVICLEDRPIGYIQSYDAYDFTREGYELNELLKGTRFTGLKLAALDFFIGEPSVLGQNIGSTAVKQFLKERIFPKFDACLVDPDKSNRGAIRTYEKAGFIPLKNSFINEGDSSRFKEAGRP